MKKIIFIIIAIVVIGGTVLAVSGMGNENSQSNVSSEKQEANTVTIKDYTFTPQRITVKKGTTVTWTNNDIAKHNVAPDKEQKGMAAGPLLSQNQNYTYTFTTPGIYNYHCDPHPYMKGVVEVTE